MVESGAVFLWLPRPPQKVWSGRADAAPDYLQDARCGTFHAPLWLFKWRKTRRSGSLTVPRRTGGGKWRAEKALTGGSGFSPVPFIPALLEVAHE